MSVQWRPELNALTTPPSYRARVIPKDSAGYRRLAERIVLKNPVCSVEQAESVLRTRDETIMELLLEGDQVSLENAFTYHLSITGRMAAPDDPLPPDSTVNIQVYAARPYAEALRQKVQLERGLPAQKVPVIAGAEDTVLELNDVLNPDGVLRLTGTDLLFDPQTEGGGECVLEGTLEGRSVQTRFATLSNSLVLMVPEIPAQGEAWNNEYRVSLSTRYTGHGSLRTGIYPRLLRTPLAISLSTGGGILSGREISPLARVTGGQLSSAIARVRIQAAINAQDGQLRLSLLDMREGGAAGNAVAVSGNGIYTLPGWAESDLSSLEVTVVDYAALLVKIRKEYTTRMVDILDVSNGT